MAKTTNVFARVEPEVKEQAEQVLTDLGIPMSNAINLYLRQIVIQRGIPFEVKLPVPKPLAMGALTDEELDAEINKGLDAIRRGDVRPARIVHAELKAKYGL